MNDVTLIASSGTELIEAVEEVLATLKGDREASNIESLLKYLSLYAWSGVTPDPFDVRDLLTEFCVAVELLAGSLIDASGSNLVSRETVEFINRVQKAAQARWDLDQGEAISIESLAVLAGVSERTIRSATNSKNPNAIPIRKEGHWTLIEAPQALKWLSGRSDFVSTQGADSRPRITALAASLDVGAAWKQWRESRKVAIEKLAEDLAWSADQTASYADIEAGTVGEAYLALSPGVWRQLAQHFESPEPSEVAALTYRRLAGAYADWRIAQSD